MKGKLFNNLLLFEYFWIQNRYFLNELIILLIFIMNFLILSVTFYYDMQTYVLILKKRIALYILKND